MRKKVLIGLILAVFLVSILASMNTILGDSDEGSPTALQKGEGSDSAHRRPRDQDNVNDEVDAPRNGFGW